MSVRKLEEFKLVVELHESTSHTLSLSEKDKDGVASLITDNLATSKHLDHESEARNFVYACVLAYFLEEMVGSNRDLTMNILKSVKKSAKDFEDGKHVGE